jgi:hypothetical protein
MGIFRTIDAKFIPKAHIAEIAELLIREEDRQELIAMSGDLPGKALIDAVEATGRAWMTFDKEQGKLIAVFGCHLSRLLRGGIIWAVLTPEVYNCIDKFNKVSRIILDNWLDKYGLLHNHVDSRNEAHIRWLKYLEFSFPVNNGVLINDVKFQYFYKEK